MKLDEAIAKDKICPCCSSTLKFMSVFKRDNYYWCENTKCEAYDSLYWKEGEGKAFVRHINRRNFE